MPWVGPFGGAGGCEAHAPLLQQTQLLCEACAVAAVEVRLMPHFSQPRDLMKQFSCSGD